MDEIGAWLAALRLEQYAEVFRRHEIDLQSLALLTEQDLTQMGVALGPRKKILSALAMPATSVPSSAKTGTPAAERRHLTILFCDMVASTEYADRLDPEDFRRLVQNFLDTCSIIIKRHQGVVVSYIGDAVMALFGYPVAGEDDAERAVLAAFDMLESVAAISASHVPLRLRIGMASGQVVVGNFPAPAGVSIVAFGQAVHVAARLQVLAEPNKILVDAATYEAANGAVEFADLGSHPLKGLAQPVQAWQALRARQLTSRFAKRTRLSKLCGRDAEIRQLIEIWEEVVSRRRGQALAISGEPGIGKSRLLHELMERVEVSNRLTLQCSPAFENSTLYPFLTEFKRSAGIDDSDPADEKRRKLQAALSVSDIPIVTTLPLFANLLSIPIDGRDAVSDIGSEHHRSVATRVLTDWIAHLAETGPILIVFEDEQWADLTSREVLAAIIGNLSFVPALILVSMRTEREAALSGMRGLIHMKLSPLGPDDATALIRDISPMPSPRDEVVNFVLDRAEGVPLYIEELARSAMEIGLDPSLPKRRTAASDIPSSLQSSLLARLDRLGPAKEIAQIAATIGREFDLDLLREASGLPEAAVAGELVNLVRSGLIVPKEVPGGRHFSFKHSLLQQAAQRTMLRERQQELHASIARAMEARGPEAYPELLARHYVDAGLFDRAADYWLLAGLKAGKTWAKTEAAEMFARGIESLKMLADSPERNRRIMRLELERGDVLYAAFGYVTGEGGAAYNRAIRLSEELGDPEAPIRALDGVFGTHFNSGQFSEALGAGERLIDIGESRNNVKALVLGLQFKGMSLFSRGQLISARLYLERSLAHIGRADEVGSDFPSMAMIYLSWTLHILGARDQSLMLFLDAEAIVRRQSPYRLAACLGNGCILFAFREDSATIMRLTDELIPLARDNGFNLWSNIAQFFRGWVLADTEGSAQGTALMSETIKSLADQEVDKSCYFGLLGKAYLRTGELDKAEEAIRQGLAQCNKIGEQYYMAELLRLRGEVELSGGVEPRLAESSFREALAFAQGQAAKSWEIRIEESLLRLHSSHPNPSEINLELH